MTRPRFGRPHVEYPGALRYQLGFLQDAGLRPMTVVEILEQRLAARTRAQYIARSWWDTPIASADVVLYHPNGEMKLARAAAYTLSLAWDSDIFNGLLVVSDDFYWQTAGPTFSLADLARDAERDALDANEARAHHVWRSLVGLRRDVLENYVTAVYSSIEGKASVVRGMSVALRPRPLLPVAGLITVNDNTYRQSSLVLGTPFDSTLPLVGVPASKLEPGGNA